ncbi:unnamed protein product [Acanthoscelides obtectus]|uniref:Uncharacterized protein n=1 Tax=Acanthoscelides obtectus TaxID=200917 RepID=A0A9P0MF67_ACAOB|nr:unnamed protein product [Acanthoscelides obtectus]CAK1645085.1 hypothetical protein AOBTE_LOCUS14017 [Acanthoscelides obtectus]
MFSRSTRHVKENPNFADTLYCQNYDTTMRSHDPLLQLSPLLVKGYSFLSVAVNPLLVLGRCW